MSQRDGNHALEHRASVARGTNVRPLALTCTPCSPRSRDRATLSRRESQSFLQASKPLRDQTRARTQAPVHDRKAAGPALLRTVFVASRGGRRLDRRSIKAPKQPTNSQHHSTGADIGSRRRPNREWRCPWPPRHPPVEPIPPSARREPDSPAAPQGITLSTIRTRRTLRRSVKYARMVPRASSVSRDVIPLQASATKSSATARQLNHIPAPKHALSHRLQNGRSEPRLPTTGAARSKPSAMHQGWEP